jgi:aminopeptidase YwaD
MHRMYFLVFLLFVSCSSKGQDQNNPEITAEEIKDHITFLASDDLGGRFTGTPEQDKAAEYIADEFKTYGLEPLINGSYYQDFPFIADLERTGNNSVEFESEEKDIELEDNQFTPLAFSGSGEAEGDLVFAGYGISAEDLEYDDYKGIDVKGKIVLVMRFNPEGNNPMSKFEKYSAMRYKAATAKEKGAAGIIFVNGHFPEDNEDQLIKLAYDGAPGIENFPAVQVTKDAADELFKLSGRNFKQVQAAIDSGKKSDSFELNIKAEVEAEVKQLEKTGRNVAGILKVNDNPEYLIVGAHYDHLGMGQTGSLHRGNEPAIHNGADDNASGTTGVLELAEKFAAEKDQLKRNIIFLAFSGEELGLLGSSYYVKNSPLPLENSVVMLNLDMIGRLNKDKELTVYGTGTSKLWKDMLKEKNKKYGFKISMNDDGYGPSDHSSFYGANMPVLFFFTGIHSDYHRPTDDAENINAEGQEQVLKLAYNILNEINVRDQRPDFVSVPRKDSGRSTSFRVYVGTVPDFGSQAEGYKISNVTEESPADKAGLKAGDIMINFGGKKIANLYDYTYALGEYKPGDKVDVMVLRDGKEVKIEIELGAR